MGGGVSVETNFPTFDAEFKFARIQIVMFKVGGGVSVEKPFSNFCC